MERWLPIKEFPNYEVSSEGRVRNIKTGRIMKQQTNHNGYKTLTLRRDNTPNGARVHRLVADAFYDGVHDGLDVNHIDGDKTNNFIGNLEWCTRKENVKHALDNGLRVNNDFGNKRIRVRIVESGIEFNSIRDCARFLGCDPIQIRDCLSHSHYTCKGLHFEKA